MLRWHKFSHSPNLLLIEHTVMLYSIIVVISLVSLALGLPYPKRCDTLVTITDSTVKVIGKPPSSDRDFREF